MSCLYDQEQYTFALIRLNGEDITPRFRMSARLGFVEYSLHGTVALRSLIHCRNYGSTWICLVSGLVASTRSSGFAYCCVLAFVSDENSPVGKLESRFELLSLER